MSINRILPIQTNSHVFQEFMASRSEITSSDKKESCLLLGDSSLLRGSLLFQAALSFANEGDQVLFIAPGSFSEKPYIVNDMVELSSLNLDLIKMVYISEPSGLLQYLCEFHTKNCFPSAIIVDDIQHYVSHLPEEQSKESYLIKLLAILQDTTAFVTQKKFVKNKEQTISSSHSLHHT